MKPWFTRCCLLLTGLLLLTACRKEAVQPESLIHAQSILDSTGVHLHCIDSEQNPCSNYILENTVTATGGGFHIRFTGVTAPDICLTSIGPARAWIDLGRLADGAYPLSFEWKGQLSVATLTVTATSAGLVFTQIAAVGPF